MRPRLSNSGTKRRASERGRTALARARLRFPPDVLAAVMRGQGPKGPIEEVARVAGILAAKRFYNATKVSNSSCASAKTTAKTVGYGSSCSAAKSASVQASSCASAKSASLQASSCNPANCTPAEMAKCLGSGCDKAVKVMYRVSVGEENKDFFSHADAKTYAEPHNTGVQFLAVAAEVMGQHGHAVGGVAQKGGAGGRAGDLAIHHELAAQLNQVGVAGTDAL